MKLHNVECLHIHGMGPCTCPGCGSTTPSPTDEIVDCGGVKIRLPGSGVLGTVTHFEPRRTPVPKVKKIKTPTGPWLSGRS